MKLLAKPFFLITLLSSFIYANEGRELYLEANCQKCHGVDNEYNPRNSKAKNINELKGWVTNCTVQLDIDWFPEEQQSVLMYLNETHYKFKN